MNRILVLVLALCMTVATPAAAQYAASNTHFFYIDTSVHVETMTFAASTLTYGDWSDLTATLGAPTPTSLSSPMTGFADGVGDHVFYASSNGHLNQLYYCGQNCIPLDTWVYQDLTTMANDPELLASGTNLSGFASSSQEHVVYTGSNQHVYQFVQTSSGSWTYQDLTSTTGGTLAATGTALTSFNDSLGQHIFYLGTNGHVYQLYYSYSTSSWADQDLTAQTGGTVAATGSALTSFADSQEHVVYEGANQDIYQLVTHPGGWLAQNLTSASSGSLAAQGSSLTSFAAGGGEYIFYTGPCVQDGESTLCEVYEFFYNGSAWFAYSLQATGAAGSQLASAGVSSSSTYYQLLQYAADCQSCGATIVAEDYIQANGEYEFEGLQAYGDDSQVAYPQTSFVIFIDP